MNIFGGSNMAKNTNSNLRNQVIYSVYVRNHTNEGTFRAVEDDLDRIKELGTDIIWFIPIHPIGKKNKKGELGCPYAIKDYRKVNPEYGTMEDFKHMVDKIHEHGMKCMIDVVYNHTSPDSWLVENHPEFFYKKPDGTMGNRVGDWTDIVDLDYSNLELWDYQIETLKQWAQIVDGFRCDVASLVPVEFWDRARRECATVKEGLIWLAESVHLGFITYLRNQGFGACSDGELYSAFDITYDYDIWDSFSGYWKGEIKASEYVKELMCQDARYPENYVKLRCLENHDQPRVKSRISDETVLKNYTAFIYFQKGTTLIYAGQEYANDYTPSLFDIDKIDRNTGTDLSDLLKKLYEIKQNSLFSTGSYLLEAEDDTNSIVGYYKNKEKEVIGIFNMSGKSCDIPVKIEDGTYTNQIDGTQYEVKNQIIHFIGNPIIIEK